MSVETDVYDALVGDATFNGIVAGRVYPEPLPDDVSFPCAGYSLISEVPMGSNKLNSYRVQVSLCAARYTQTRTMRAALWDIVNGNTHWQIANVGPDMYEEVGSTKYRYLPVDIMVIQGE